MIEINDKYQCCGCTACVNICPKNCITMAPDEEGFLYPEVNKDLCINCGLCEKVCPVIKPADIQRGERTSYAIRSKNSDVLRNSTSGGFFTPLANYVLNNGGVICAVTYSDEWMVAHEFLTESNEEAFAKYRGSKYVQSHLGDCFSRIKEYLTQGRFVCFIGTTCQVNGLKKYVGDDKNLVTVDLVCHGTPSPKLWSKYINYQQEKYNSKITSVSFRNKTYGYHSGTMKIEFANGKTYYGSARVDYMLKSFFREISSRPICYQCPFKQVERCSDLTIYDCWHFSDLVKGEKDDDKGYTNVIVQSEKGVEILKALADKLEIYQVDTQKAIELDGVMVTKAAVPHPKRKDYYKDLDKETLPQHIQRFIPVMKKDILIEKSKRVLYKLGIFNLVKKFK